MLLVRLLLRAPVPALDALKATPLWSSVGGIMGVAFLVLAILAAPKAWAWCGDVPSALAVAGRMTLTM